MLPAFLDSRLRGNDKVGVDFLYTAQCPLVIAPCSIKLPSPACGRGVGGEGNNRLRGNDGAEWLCKGFLSESWLSGGVTAVM